MLRSMYSGISGLKNLQTKLDVIGNNVANVNTYGFKKSRVTFSDAMNQTVSGASAATANKGGTNSKQIGLGSTIATIDTIHTQSSLQTTGRDLDLGISGDGYFVVKQGDSLSYTRAGNFYLDDNGTLVNANGLKVQAYKIDENGKRSKTIGDVAVNVNAILPAITTTKISVSGNLASDAIDGTVFSQQMKVVDEKGKEQTATIYFQKNGDDKWELFDEEPAALGDTSATKPKPFTSVNFDGNGQIVAADKTQTGQTINISSGNEDDSDTAVDESVQKVNLDFDFSNLTQVKGSTTALVNPDGNKEGKLESFNIGSSGEINGVYSNGLITTLGQLAVAKFSNASGLTKTGGNTFQESINSGTANINIAGEGRGVIASGSLEMSNVDLSEEFTEMIVAQRGFQSNSRIITTSDEILQELVNLKR
ncbi:flagellar hook protein FlgE [Peribacillus simplex]|uniref:flagellar hook protein FlgE n=1 Tax=Bacillaceae TaxID=186817 RepID=UPI0006611488|nr:MULTISPECIES: flagellar hook protein FlgE [Bacillaceae]MBD8587324.1 flagellar hook protein FlgE [Peribacillus simplex]MCF7621760.1 flagellar hook protein FlgE [Peribacillus frigoritolerans]MEA3572850.1 flagellar hook protein FlgE [Peribacillus frigoritolerans]PRA97422.1 flagellar hook protein FlgE [Peribacillus simplex]